MHKNKKYVSGTKMFSKKMMSLSMHLQYEQHSHKTSYGNVIFICLQYYSQLISSWSRKANLQQFAEQIGNKKKNLVLACLKISISSFSQLRPIYIISQNCKQAVQNRILITCLWYVSLWNFLWLMVSWRFWPSRSKKF